jgi:hypothetical protein
VPGPAGPGVVPDKPALAPEPACSTCNDTGTVVVYEGNSVSFTYDLPCTDCADLRSAGFLIVHHTKET